MQYILERVYIKLRRSKNHKNLKVLIHLIKFIIFINFGFTDICTSLNNKLLYDLFICGKRIICGFWGVFFLVFFFWGGGGIIIIERKFDAWSMYDQLINCNFIVKNINMYFKEKGEKFLCSGRVHANWCIFINNLNLFEKSTLCSFLHIHKHVYKCTYDIVYWV